MQHIHNATFLTDSTTTGPAGAPDLTDDELRDLYEYPADITAPWIRMNFVSSIDGAVTIDGSSTGLGTPADKKVFGILRELADVVLVGAGTARTEGYKGVRTNEARRQRRLERGLTAVPPIAVVSTHASVDPESFLLTDTSVPPIILTSTDASSERKAALRKAGAEVFEIGTGSVPSEAILRTLDELGLHRVLCEGGPTLFGQLIEDDAVDELCMTTSPLLTGGASGRISKSPNGVRNQMACRHILTDEDATMLSRWVRARDRR